MRLRRQLLEGRRRREVAMVNDRSGIACGFGYIQWRGGISQIIQPIMIYIKFLRESMASTSELAHTLICEHDLHLHLILSAIRASPGAPNAAALPCSASPASRHHLRNRSCSSRLGLSTLPASSLILHLSLTRSFLLLLTPLVALYHQHRL